MRAWIMAGSVALAACAVVAGPALAQTEDASPSARLAGRLDPATAAAVLAVIDSAASAGLPAGPLVQKALEGTSKRAAPERIVFAVRGLSADLRAARAALGASASEPELVAGVGALRAGAGVEALARVKAARGAQSALLPLAVLSDLVAQGTPVDRAVEAVTALAERRASDAQYRALPAGRPPAAAGPPPHARPAAPPAKGRPAGRP